jgi:hypothetical protein
MDIAHTAHTELNSHVFVCNKTHSGTFQELSLPNCMPLEQKH